MTTLLCAAVLLVHASSAQCAVAMQFVGIQTKPSPTMLFRTPGSPLPMGVKTAKGGMMDDDAFFRLNGSHRRSELWIPAQDVEGSFPSHLWLGIDIDSPKLCPIVSRFIKSLSPNPPALELRNYRVFWQNDGGQLFALPQEVAAFFKTLLREFHNQMGKKAIDELNVQATNMARWAREAAAPQRPSDGSPGVP